MPTGRRTGKINISHIRIGTIITIIVTIALAAFGTKLLPQNQAESRNMELGVEILSSSCLSGQSLDMDIMDIENSIVITAPIETPTPCYDINSNATLAGNNIDIKFYTFPKPGICIQCVGIVVTKATVRDLDPGIYSLKVTTPNRATITEITVSVK